MYIVTIVKKSDTIQENFTLMLLKIIDVDNHSKIDYYIGMGRPTKYDPKLLPQIKKYTAAGLIDEQLAVVLGVSVSTINLWKEEHPEFSESIKEGKTTPNGKVVQSLFKRACGFIDSDGREYPPDTTACIYWTKNRMPDDWRDKQERDLNITNWPKSVKVEIVRPNEPEGA